MKNLLAYAMLTVAIAGTVLANPGPPPAVPEIDPGSVVNAVALLSGAWMLRGRRSR